MRIYAKFVDSTSSGNPGRPMIATVRTLDEQDQFGRYQIEIHKHSIGSLYESYKNLSLKIYDTIYQPMPVISGIDKFMEHSGWIKLGGYYSNPNNKTYQELIIVAMLLKHLSIDNQILNNTTTCLTIIKDALEIFKKHFGKESKAMKEYWDEVVSSLLLMAHKYNLTKIITTLGKEENIMSKPDVIVGIVAMPTKKVQATKVVADYIRKRVTVLFSDGGKEVVDCHAEDEFDVVVGYSIAVTRHMAGSSGAVRRDINSVLLEVKPKIKKGETKKATVVKKPHKASKTKKGSK